MFIIVHEPEIYHRVGHIFLFIITKGRNCSVRLGPCHMPLTIIIVNGIHMLEGSLLYHNLYLTHLARCLQ